MKIPKKLLFNFFTKQAYVRLLSEKVLGRRLSSMNLDFSFMAYLITPIALILFLPLFILVIEMESLSFIGEWIALLPGTFMIYIILNKDFYNGRSVGKRIYGYQVIDTKTKQTASELQCMIRNCTVMIWPIEVLITKLSPSRRLGDFLAGTELVNMDKVDPELIMNEINEKRNFENKTKFLWMSILITLILCVLIISL